MTDTVARFDNGGRIDTASSGINMDTTTFSNTYGVSLQTAQTLASAYSSGDNTKITMQDLEAKDSVNPSSNYFDIFDIENITGIQESKKVLIGDVPGGDGTNLLFRIADTTYTSYDNDFYLKFINASNTNNIANLETGSSPEVNTRNASRVINGLYQTMMDLADFMSSHKGASDQSALYLIQQHLQTIKDAIAAITAVGKLGNDTLSEQLKQFTQNISR